MQSKSEKIKYQFNFEHQEHCYPKLHSDLEKEFDKFWKKRYGELLHSTTVELLADVVLKYLKKKSKRVKS